MFARCDHARWVVEWCAVTVCGAGRRFVACECDVDRAAAGHAVGGVEEEVDEDLFEEWCVDEGGGVRGEEAAVGVDAGVKQLFGDGVECGLDDGANIGGLSADDVVAGEREEATDDGFDARESAVDEVEHLSSALWVIDGSAEDACAVLYAVERVIDFVCDVGGEFAEHGEGLGASELVGELFFVGSGLCEARGDEVDGGGEFVEILAGVYGSGGDRSSVGDVGGEASESSERTREVTAGDSVAKVGGGRRAENADEDGHPGSWEEGEREDAAGNDTDLEEHEKGVSEAAEHERKYSVGKGKGI